MFISGVICWGYMLGFYALVEVLSSRSSGGGPTASNFFYSLRSPYGAPFRRSANYAVLQQKKVTKKCRNLTAKLDHDGCISKCCLSSSSRGFIAKRYRGYFFVLHLHQALRSSLPVSGIVVLLFITLCLTLTLLPSNPHHAQ